MTDLPTTSPAFDLIIRGGTVIDGTRAPRFQADVGITDGRIAVIGPLDNRTAAREIDATGRIVAPGKAELWAGDHNGLAQKAEVEFD